jgi:transposase
MVEQTGTRRREVERERRRRYQDFVLLVGHKDLPQKAAELAELYHAKDVVERDFRIIKSVVELRPVYHYTDPKVRAHVTLCVLSLLLQRTLEMKLAAAGRAMSATTCLELLKSCQLNQYESSGEISAVYQLTQPTAEQKDILKALGLSHLVDNGEVSRRLVPRGK